MECAVRFSSDTRTNLSRFTFNTWFRVKTVLVLKVQNYLARVTMPILSFQNIDRFFARDAQQMCAFTTAGVVDQDYDSYIDKHPKLASILNAMTKEEASCFKCWILGYFTF